MSSKVRPVRLLRRPTVSVVVPCYRYGHYLPACTASVLTQLGVELEVVIVDDASPDDSAEVARELTADPRVRLIQHPSNRGHIATYNDGLAAATGEYVLLLSADDLLAPGSLERAAALLDANPGTGFVYGHCPAFSVTPPAAPPSASARSWTVWDGVDWIEEISRSVTNPVDTPGVVMRASVLREVGGYDARLPHAADLLMWLRAAATGDVGRINGADQAYYRRHETNMHTQQFGGAYPDFVERVRTFELFFDEAPGLAAGDRLRTLARTALGREALVIAARADTLPYYRDSPVDAFVSMAEQLAPRGTHAPLWAAYERAVRRAADGRLAGVYRKADVVIDDVFGRVRWRRWRRSGIYSSVRSL